MAYIQKVRFLEPLCATHSFNISFPFIFENEWLTERQTRMYSPYKTSGAQYYLKYFNEKQIGHHFKQILELLSNNQPISNEIPLEENYKKHIERCRLELQNCGFTFKFQQTSEQFEIMPFSELRVKGVDMIRSKNDYLHTFDAIRKKDGEVKFEKKLIKEKREEKIDEELSKTKNTKKKLFDQFRTAEDNNDDTLTKRIVMKVMGSLGFETNLDYKPSDKSLKTRMESKFGLQEIESFVLCGEFEIFSNFNLSLFDQTGKLILQNKSPLKHIIKVEKQILKSDSDSTKHLNPSIISETDYCLGGNPHCLIQKFQKETTISSRC